MRLKPHAASVLRLLRVPTLALSLAFTARGQQPPAAPLPLFDVVAIHQDRSPIDSMSIRWGGDAFVASNATFATLLVNAYNIREDLISGLPRWAGSVHFDVNAKVSDPDADALKRLTREQHRAMMVALLADRFHLRARIVTRTLPVYDLVLAREGPRLKPDPALPSATAGPAKTPFHLQPGSFLIRDSHMIAVAVPLSMLAANLALQVQRNVVDKTGLTGRYDIDLQWTPADQQDNTGDTAPGLFTALQEQLGLKLEPSRGPVETLVVDHVEMPTAN